jgi:hypothetical protein
MNTIESEYKVTKSYVTSYKIRKQNGHGWADITVDIGKECVRLQISSDYGDWQNFWGSTGIDPIDFLKKIDIGYAASKFGCGRHFNSDKTIVNIKKQIIEYRREDGLSEMVARQYYDDIKEAESEFVFYEEKDLYFALQGKDIYDFFSDGLPIATEVEPGFRQFWMELWPIFLTAI